MRASSCLSWPSGTDVEMDDERTRPAQRDTDRAKFGIGGLASH